MARKAGRPNEETQARELLILHARELFVALPYEKVSTRAIADKAGLNVAMIRYYFGNKQGLFESMIRETVKPIQKQMSTLVQKGSQESLMDLMRSYYRTMASTPQFPRLIAQVMNMPESELQRKILDKVFNETVKPAQDLIFERLVQEGILRKELDPKLCRVTFFSLMVFPFIAPRSMMQFHGVNINEAFLNQLLEHNIDVLSHGFLSPQLPSFFGEQNEN